MQKKRADILKREWGGRPCAHPKLAKEYDMGERTGSYVCTQCGTVLSFREKAERAAAGGTRPSNSNEGKAMKKSSRNIPDFSRKQSGQKPAGGASSAPPVKGKVVASTSTRPKPKATSAKSSQRGK